MGSSFFQRLERRWDRRDRGWEPVIVCSSTVIEASPRQVWDFLMAPESAYLTSAGVLKAFRVPGTPVGVSGEQICVVSQAGGRVSADIIETVSAEPLKTLVAKAVTGPNEVVQETTLQPSEGGRTTVTMEVSMHVALGASAKVEPALQRELEEAVGRIRAAVESGARSPSIDG